jgi:predicted RNA-binding protein associated with RNAse of E/G family
VSWDDEGEFLGWYVNLEDPWRRTHIGWDSTDHLLDLRVDPSRKWYWRDEDHLAEAFELGLFSSQQAAAIRAEGERAIERIDGWLAPFNERWEEWRPDSGWRLPRISDGWERLEAPTS